MSDLEKATILLKELPREKLGFVIAYMQGMMVDSDLHFQDFKPKIISKVRVKEEFLRKNKMLGTDDRWLNVIEETDESYLVIAKDLQNGKIKIPKDYVIQKQDI